MSAWRQEIQRDEVDGWSMRSPERRFFIVQSAGIYGHRRMGELVTRVSGVETVGTSDDFASIDISGVYRGREYIVMLFDRNRFSSDGAEIKIPIVGIVRDDAMAGPRFAKGVVYGLIVSVAIWSVVIVLLLIR